MNMVDGIGVLLAAGLFVYLVVALLYPERFQ
jgi:K+-transporting ATPase KdpF subunit